MCPPNVGSRSFPTERINRKISMSITSPVHGSRRDASLAALNAALALQSRHDRPQGEGRQAMTTPAALSVAGVVLLFRYGMPYRVETGGAIYLAPEQEDASAKGAERWYRVLGWIGLVMIVVGTALQIAGAVLA